MSPASGRTVGGIFAAARRVVRASAASLLDEAVGATAASSDIRDYLGELLDHAYWRRYAGEPLPPPRSRASFARPRRPSRPATAGAQGPYRLCSSNQFAYEDGYNSALQRQSMDTSWAAYCAP